MSNASDQARILRLAQTPPEGVLWSKLRNRQLGGLKFRRQHPIDPYVVDFACPEAKLVVEVDSRYHDGRQRDDALAEQGWMVIRVSTSDLASNLAGVLQKILETARSRLDA